MHKSFNEIHLSKHYTTKQQSSTASLGIQVAYLSCSKASIVKVSENSCNFVRIFREQARTCIWYKMFRTRTTQTITIFRCRNESEL